MLSGYSWAEPYDNFLLWLSDAGIRVDNLPQWQPTRPVKVVADVARRCFWIQKATRREVRECEEKSYVVGVDLKTLAREFERCDIVEVDAKKLASWQH